MKKPVSLMMATIMLFTAGSATLMSGCGKSGSAAEVSQTMIEVSEPDLDELRTREGTMLYVGESYDGSVNEVDDYWTFCSYDISWDGKITRAVTYTLSGDVVEEDIVLSDEDYRALYMFAESAYLNNTFAEYSEKVDNGETWSFIYYPADIESGAPLYSGYCSENADLNRIKEIVRSYFTDFNVNGPLYVESEVVN